MSKPATSPVPGPRPGLQPALVPAPLLLAAVLASGCGIPPDEEVEFYMPLHRLDLPERPFRRFNAWMAGASGTGKVVLAENQSQAAPDPLRPRVTSANGAGVFAIEAYPVSWLGLAVKGHGDVNEEQVPEWLGGKLHLFGPAPGRAAAGDVSLALTYGVGSATNDHYGNSSGTDLKSNARDYALVGGWRVSRRLLLYGGPFRHTQDYSGTRRAGSTTVSLSGEAEMSGYNVGLSITPVRWMSIVAEYAHGEIETGESRGNADSINAGLQFNFGWKLDPSVR